MSIAAMVERTQIFRAQGLCRVCGADAGDFVSCHEHRMIDRQKKRDRAADARMRGLCTSCVKVPPRPGKTQCEGCAARQSRYARKLSDSRRAQGLCAYCGIEEPAEGKKLCDWCAEQRRAA